MKRFYLIVLCMLLGAGLTFAQTDSIIGSDDGGLITSGPSRVSDRAGNTIFKNWHWEVKAASAEIHTTTVDVRGFKEGMIQIGAGHIGATTFSTSGSMEVNCKVWLEASAGTSGANARYASMPAEAASGGPTEVTTAIGVKGIAKFKLNGAAYIRVHIVGNGTTDKQIVVAVTK